MQKLGRRGSEAESVEKGEKDGKKVEVDDDAQRAELQEGGSHGAGIIQEG